MGECDAEYTPVWKIWPLTATEMPSDAPGRICTNDLKECQHICGKDGEMNARDHARGCAQSKPLPNVIQFFSGQSHSLDAKRTQRRRRIEDLRQDLDVGGVV